MRKTIFFASLVLAASVAFLTGCAKEVDAPEDTKIEDDATIDPNEESLPGIPFELIAGTSEDTKTTMSGGNPVWEADNSMNVFYAPTTTSTYSTNCEFTITSANLAEKKFTGTLPGSYDSEKSYDWYALYPYKSAITTPATTSGDGWLPIGSANKGTNQVQTGNSNMDHLAGQYFPLYGKVTGVAGATIPNLTMKQALAVVRVRVTNSCTEDLTVTSVGFTAPEAIIGTFWFDFHGDDPVIASSGASYVSNTASLTVNSGSAITTGNTGDFYLAIKPITVATDAYITVTVNGIPKKITMTKDVTFSAGKIKTVNYNYKDFVELPWESAEDGEGVTSEVLNAVDGVSVSSDGNYASGPYYIKFTGNTHNITVKTDSEIGSVSVAVKAYSAGSGTTKSEIIVSSSANGSSWTEVERFDLPDATKTNVFTTTTDFTSSHRYVKIGFNKALNNAGIGRIAISGPSTDPRIVADPIEVDALGGVNLLSDYEAQNFVGGDDVSVKGHTGCVSAATIEGGKIKYTVNPNYSTSSDTGTITLQSAEASDKVVNVTQTGNTFSQSGASGSPLVLTISSDATTAEINLTSTVFGWNASVTPATEKNLTIKTGASTYVTSTTGTKSADAQTLTISSTEAAPTSGDPLVLGTLVLYRNGNSSDPQGISITVKKAVSGATLTDGAQYDYTFTNFPFDDAETDTKTLGLLSWDYETDSEYHVYDNGSDYKCLHFGSSKKTVSYVNFTLGYLSYCNSATAKLVKTVKVKARGNGTDPKLEVLVGGVSIEEKTITNSMDEYTFTVTGEKYGNIEIRMSYSSAAKKNLCIQQVKINK